MSIYKRILYLLCLVFIATIFVVIIYLNSDINKADSELNKSFSPISQSKIYSYSDSDYYWYYRKKFENLSINTIPLSMGLDWFVNQYDEVYTGKAEHFYISAFDTPNTSTKDLLSLYNNNPDGLYYLKPYLDCYCLMDKNKKLSDKELENIKETILYALEYYINGKDFVGTLE